MVFEFLICFNYLELSSAPTGLLLITFDWHGVAMP